LKPSSKTGGERLVDLKGPAETGRSLEGMRRPVRFQPRWLLLRSIERDSASTNKGGSVPCQWDGYSDEVATSWEQKNEPKYPED